MSNTKLLEASQIEKFNSYDLFGYVFYWNDRIFRAIYPESKEHVLHLWECGLIQELIKEGLFPESRLTQYITEDCSLVIEHDKLSVITLPHEWSFSMLKDAALAILIVNKKAKKYGYQTLDAHGYNIAFHKNKAIFFDLGSFVRIENNFNCNKAGWRPYGEFMRFFYGPLKIWSQGDEFFARQSLYGLQMPMTSFWRYRSIFARIIPLKYLKLFENYWYSYKALNTIHIDRFLQVVSVSYKREKLGNIIIFISKIFGLPFSSINLNRLEKKVVKIKLPKIPSAWSDYHVDQKVNGRLIFIKEAIDRYKPETVLDLAGNAGNFSKVISQVSGVKYVICADNDSNAIDCLYRSIEKNTHKIYPVVMNFSISIADLKFPSVKIRFKSDMVIALALTHHLILSQRLTIDFIMQRLFNFTNKYVAVEFMPLGLYSSKFNKTPIVPKWYSIDWFREGFKRTFLLLEEKEIGVNRVIFIGERKISK